MKIKILITGSNCFIVKNLVSELRNKKYEDLFLYDYDSTEQDLDRYTREAEFIFHLAGINRPKEEKEFMEGNFGFTSSLINKLKYHGNNCPIMIASSTQAELDNPYGNSKKAGEKLIFSYAAEKGAKVLVYRFPNVFGKWCRPNYNSAVATFSHNIANNLPIMVNNPNVCLNLVYIDDLVKELINALAGLENRKGDFSYVEPVYNVMLGRIVELLYSFKESRNNCYIPNMSDGFTKKLYSSYLSYLPKEQFSYHLKTNFDDRGSFTEFIKTADRGQVSINISKPGVTKGNHWHHTKTEKFLVVSGRGIIRFRNIDETEIVEYHVSGNILQVIDVPSGYTHNIENLGDTDMITIIWANETFDSDNPDTYFMEV
jgi:UDP-2-acetamido-2,6-beta-L-arabino-hexul-4-ose reductase